MKPTGDTRRVTVQEAMRILGISEHAVRMRAKRGSLKSEKGNDGRVYIYIPAEATADPSEEPSVESAADTGEDTPLVRSLEARIESLERQLEEANTRDRESRRLLAAALERIPELEAPLQTPQEAQEAAESASEGGESRGGERREEPTQAHSASEQPRVPWLKRSWRRIFGG